MNNTEEYIYPTGFEDAIIGCDMENMRFVMDKGKMVDILIEKDGMTYEDAVEFCAYNIWNAYVSQYQPIYVDLGTLEELTDILGL
jgi:hypothetical protein